MKNSNKIALVSEILLSFAIVLLVAFFAIMTFGDNNKVTPSQEMKISYAPSQFSTKSKEISDRDDITNWIIINVNEDYSIAKVLKPNGHMYYVTIYEAYDNIVCFCDNKGNIHEFYYYSK